MILDAWLLIPTATIIVKLFEITFECFDSMNFDCLVDCYDVQKWKDCDDVDLEEFSGFHWDLSHPHYDVGGEKKKFRCLRDFQCGAGDDHLGCVGHVDDVKFQTRIVMIQACCY